MHLLLSELDRLSVGEVAYPPGGTLGPRRQRDTQLVLVHSGSVRVRVDGGAPLTLAAGAVGLLRPGHVEEFAFAPDRSTRHSWVQMPLALPDGLQPTLPASVTLTQLIADAVAAARAGRPARALAAAALWRYAGEAQARAGDGADIVAAAGAFLHAHQADPRLDLARVAGAVHVTPAHLVRRFRAELGTTPMAYLWERRVATGIDLLTGTGLPVGEIAARAGFKSVYHFSRRVKAATGVPPTRVRERAWSYDSRRMPEP
jgi:AraC-like DNA-binding protein